MFFIIIYLFIYFLRKS